MGTPEDSKRTRAKIITAAGTLFADHGYHGVTVRDIVKQAETHLSALNYHFASKEALYREVLCLACESPESAKLDLVALQQRPAREAFEEVVKAWIRDYTHGDSGGWKAKLVDRECLEPSPIFQEVVAAKILPEFDFVGELLGRVVGRPARSTAVRAAVLGLLGQITVLTLYRQLLESVTQGMYEGLHRGDWLAHALAASAIAMVKAAPEEPAP